MADDSFSLDDIHRMIGKTGRIGPVSWQSIPLPQLMNEMLHRDERTYQNLEGELKRFAGIINSMTPVERRSPELIHDNRRKRIVAGAGVEPEEVKKIVRDFLATQNRRKDPPAWWRPRKT